MPSRGSLLGSFTLMMFFSLHKLSRCWCERWSVFVWKRSLCSAASSGAGVQRAEPGGDHRHRVRGRPHHAALHGSRASRLEKVRLTHSWLIPSPAWDKEKWQDHSSNSHLFVNPVTLRMMETLSGPSFIICGHGIAAVWVLSAQVVDLHLVEKMSDHSSSNSINKIRRPHCSKQFSWKSIIKLKTRRTAMSLIEFY